MRPTVSPVSGSRTSRSRSGNRTARSGSSPLARGTHETSLYYAALARFIPARAGNTRRIAERLGQPGFEAIGITRADGVRDVIRSRVETPAGLDDVYIPESFVDHIVAGKRDHRERFADWILPSLRDPAEVWLTEVTDGRGRKAYRRRFITAFQEAGRDKPTIAVTQEGKDGSLAWTFMRADARYLNDQRSGFLLYRRPPVGRGVGDAPPVLAQSPHRAGCAGSRNGPCAGALGRWAAAHRSPHPRRRGHPTREGWWVMHAGISPSACIGPGTWAHSAGC